MRPREIKLVLELEGPQLQDRHIHAGFMEEGVVAL